MIFKEKKYQGEIWIPGNEDKYFCILTIENKEILLETNLFDRRIEYKLDEIYGKFNGLGYLTFINNEIRRFGSHLIQSRLYCPEYSFISDHHFIDGRNLKLKEFVVENSAIVDWFDHTMYLYKPSEDEIERIADDLDRCFLINELGLEIHLKTYSKYRSTRQGMDVIHEGTIKFISKYELTVFEAKEIYDTFQKFLLFFHGKSVQFNRFSFKCLGCENWVNLYYRNNLEAKRSSQFLTYRYKNISDDLDNIILDWYTNKNLIYCIDMILENQLSVKISHSRKLINSIFALEAFYKRFSDKTHHKLQKILLSYDHLLQDILKKSAIEVEEFTKQVVSVRKDLVHGNLKQKPYFTQFELLYISILIDYILAIEILELMKVSEENIKMAKMWAENAYHQQQSINTLLNQNILLR